MSDTRQFENSPPSPESAYVRGFASQAQELLLAEVVDAILAKVFQGKRPGLRAHMLNVAGKVSRRHPWPFFEEVVAAEVQRRIDGAPPLDFMAASAARRACPEKS